MKNIILAILTGTLILGCSSKPSESDAEEMFKNDICEKEKYIINDLDCDDISIVDFEKINGFENKDGTYVVEFTYGGVKIDASDEQIGEDAKLVFKSIKDIEKSFKMASKFQKSYKMTFVNSEKGWVAK